MAIIYRSIKGSELTSDEVDGNFQFLSEEKQDNLTFDSTPTAASLNPVTSGGVFTALDDLSNDIENGRTENFNWRFDASTTASDPGVGKFRANNATPASVTQLYIDSICADSGLDIDNIFGIVDGAWSIYIQQTGDSTKFAQYSTSGTYTNNGGWWTVPVTYVQSGSGGALTNNTKCTFYLTNKNSIPTTRSLNINGDVQNLSADRTWRTSMADTGVLSYAGASAASGTTINVGAVDGWIIDNETTPGTPVKTHVTYAGASGVTVTTIGSGLASYLLLNSSGSLVFQNTFPTSAQRKTMIYLSKIGHPAGTITTVGNEPDFILSPTAQLRDLAKYIGFINPDVHPSANGSNLNINTSAGTVYRASGNFVTSNTIPNEVTVAAQTVASFLYRTQTGAGGGFVTAIDPTTYDNAGTSTAIGGSSNQATNQRIFLVPGLGFIIQKGQTIYSTLTDAIAAVQNESFIIYPSLVNNAILIGVLSVTKGCTLLNDTTTARFFLSDKFGQVGGSTAGVSTATLQIAYNNSATPEILTNSTLGALSLKRGSSADTDSVLEIINGSNATTINLKGDGSHVFSPSAQSSGNNPLGTWTGAAHTSQTASTELTDINFNLARTLQFSTGAITTQRASRIQAPTYSFTGASVITNAATLSISGAPTAGTNATITNNLALVVESGGIGFLDTTFKTALDVSSGTVLRLGNSFATVTTPVSDFIFSTNNSVIRTLTAGHALNLQTIGGNTASQGIVVGKSAAISNTTGTTNVLNPRGSWTPGSGTGNLLNYLLIDPTFNQTGGTANSALINLAPVTVTSITGTVYGLRSQLAASPSGGGTTYNIYADGTAANYFAGNTSHGTTTNTASLLTLGASTTSISSLRILSGTAPSSPNDGDMWYDGTNVKFRIGGTTKTFTLT